MSKSFLQVQHISKTFPGVNALDDVSFEVLKGEVHILLGQNGAGKSTLVKILSGAYQPTRGQIFFNGLETRIRDPRQAQALGIAVIYQEFNLIPHLTAGENIFLGREPMRSRGIIDNQAIHSLAQKILDGLNVKIDARRRVEKMAVAQQQMVEIAKALSIKSRILILDEPTSALTEREIEQLFLTLRLLKKNGVSIIFISHRLEELFVIGDRVTVLRDGKAVGTYPIASLSKTKLIRLMANRELKEQYPKRSKKPGRPVLNVSGLVRKGVLKHVSLVLHEGEILGIAGLLGSGRTELARSIFGADPVDTGTLQIHGEGVLIRSPNDAIRHGIGFLTEDRKGQGLILSLSVRENICLPSTDRLSHWGIVNSAEAGRTTGRYINELNIKTTGSGQKVLFLSGGNQQKVVIAKWLCSMSKILIFDEPTRGIDVASKVEIYEWMNRLTAEGAGILMISSDIPEILGMSDRILVMHNGAIAGEFARNEATQEKILHYALGVSNAENDIFSPS